MAGLRQDTDRRAAVGSPYGMLRGGLRTGVVEWLLERVPTPRRTPFTLGYLAVVGITATFARLADPELVQHLQEASSSDGHNLLLHPLRVLVLSGFWVAGGSWTPYLWGFAVTLAPLERRVGSARAAAVFAAGHVVATLLSQGVVIAAVRLGRMAPEAMDRLDIGVSYGVFACLGAVIASLPLRWRVPALAGAALMIAQQIASQKDLVTAIGHPAALLTGVALWRWVRWVERGPSRPRLRLPRLPLVGAGPVRAAVRTPAVVRAGTRPSTVR
ncbi:rhomboid-like protein [Kitasatospora sp. NPDC089509]|uniref:rhomboid-like protein n=1 Tax=Kitasatospora sp. NPDC089509 TaxID=3364079 RepID=UPI0037FD9550